MKKVQQGFTLIELMIVVAIIGILAAIAIPQYQNYVARSQMSSALATINPLKTAAEDLMLRGEPIDDVAALGTTTNASDLGVIAETLDTATGSGAITFTLSGEVSPAVNNAVITLTRDPDGTWDCSTTASANEGWDDGFAPAGCAVGAGSGG